MGQAVFGREVGEFFPIEFADAAVKGPKPEVVLLILQDGIDDITQAPIDKYFSAKFTDTRIGAQPEIAFPIFQNSVDTVVAQALFYCKIREFFSVKFTDPTIGAQPEGSVSIL